MLILQHDSTHRARGDVSRRDFLRAGTLAIGGVSLSDWLALQAHGGRESRNFVKNKSVVLLFLSGGGSHIESFNPNMDAPAPYRSVTGEVSTPVTGLTFGGTFPQLARHADKMAVVRSFQHPVAGHAQAIKHVLNGGSDPNGEGKSGFSIGSAYARLAGANHESTGMPTYTLLNTNEVDRQYRKEKDRVVRGSHPGPLGPVAKPFIPGAGGNAQQDMRLNIPRSRFDTRRSLLAAVDRLRRAGDQEGMFTGADKYRSQAMNLILGSAAQAFDLTQEPRRLFERYDTSMFRVGKANFRDSVLGKHFLTARRLLEAGCRFVTIHSGGWDMHADGNNPGILAGMEMLGRPLDKAVSAFLEDLESRGMLDETLLVITGDFGRTPKINGRGGRDHWPRLSTLAFAGGGMTGQVVGRSARNNDEPATDPINAHRLLATIMHSVFDIGLLRLKSGLPPQLVRLIEQGQPIPELVG